MTFFTARARRLIPALLAPALALASGTTALHAAAWYISPSGSDSSGTGTIDKPFATFGKCGSRMAPGDTCYARGGTYTTSGTEGWIIDCAGGTSNTARKTFTSYGSETAVIQPSSYMNKTITIRSGPKYVTFRNLTIKGKISVLATNGGADYMVFENNRFMCPGENGSGNANSITTQTFAYPDWEQFQGLVVRNNMFLTDNTCAFTYTDEADFMHLYGTDGAVIENNDFIYKKTGDPRKPRFAVWLKGRNERAVIRFNYAYGDFGSSFAINGDMCSAPTTYCANTKPTGVAQNKIYQNVSDRSGGIGFDSATFGENDLIYNNTIYKPLNDAFHAAAGNNKLVNEQVFNNIVYGDSRTDPGYYAYVRWDGQAAPTGSGVCGQSYFDNNVYYPVGANRRNFANLQDQAVTFADWQKLLASRCSNTNVRESRSRRVDPLFVNAANRDFRLASNSPARSGGRGSGFPSVVGAYVTGSEVIGCTYASDCSASGRGVNSIDEQPTDVQGLIRADAR